MSYEPGTYVNGERVRVANTSADAVALVFDGFARVDEAATDDSLSYRELQEQAKALGVPANQSEAALREAIANYEPANEPADES